MKISTLKKYINILKDVKKSGLSIRQYCKLNNMNVANIYATINSLKKQHEEDSELVSELISLYNELTKKEIKNECKEESVNEDNRSNVKYVRNNSGQIQQYNIEVYKKDRASFKTNLSREAAETIFGLYTYYGGNITSRNVANEFPEYTVPEIKQIFKAFRLTKDSIWCPPHLLEEMSPEQLSIYRMNLKERAAFKYADASQEREFKNSLNKMASRIKQLEDRNEFFKDLAKSELSFSKVPTFKKNNFDTTGVLLISDIHVGAVNSTNGYLPLKDYSEQEINLRLDRILERISGKNWNNLVVINLGDSVDSYKGTTAKGTPLPTQYSDKEMSKMYLRIMTRFMTSLKHLFPNVQYICTGDSNHDGAFGWLNNIALSYQLENIGISCYISDNPIDNINIGEFSLIYLHGHDSKTQFKGFPLHLDEKTKNWFNNFFLQAPMNFEKNKLVIKGDLHQFAIDSCNTFDYINVPSVYGSSAWITSNFGKGKQGAIYLEINNDNYNVGTIWV